MNAPITKGSMVSPSSKNVWLWEDINLEAQTGSPVSHFEDSSLALVIKLAAIILDPNEGPVVFALLFEPRALKVGWCNIIALKPAFT